MSTTESEDKEPKPNEPVLVYAGVPQASAAAVVWCRLLAVWMLAWGIHSGAAELQQVWQFTQYGRAFSTIQWIEVACFSFATAGIWFIFSWYCWTKASELGRKMSERVNPPVSLSPMTADELLHVLLLGVGVFLLADGLPITLGALFQFFFQRFHGTTPQQFELQPYMIPPITRCALGLWLVLRTHQATALLRRLGPKPADDPRNNSAPRR